MSGKTLENFGNKITGISDKISDIGGKLTKNITVPIVGAATIAIKSASDFESAWTGVTKTVDGTEEQMEKLRQGIIDMSEQLPSSTKEIASVAEAAGQLGIKTDDILSFTKVMIDLGNSTNLSADEAASALAKFANITNMSADDYDRLGSVIVDLGNNFATTEADIVQMSTKLAATGELTGLTQAQIMALATAMSSVGIEAEAGGTAMSKLLKKIQVAAETGSDELEQFASVAGVTGEEFKQAFEKDAVNALSMFLSGLQDTERNGKSAIAILDEMDIREVRLSNTILALSNSNELLSDAVNTANTAWDKNSALQNEANKRYETFASQLEIAKNKAQNLAASFGEKLLPHAIKLLDKVEELIEGFGNLSDEEQQNIIKWVGIAAAIGPVLSILGKIGSVIGTVTTGIGKISEKIGQISSSSGELSKNTSKLGSAFSTLGVAIAGVTAAYTAYKLIDEHYKAKAEQQVKSINDVTEAVKASNDAWTANRKAQEENVNGSLSQISYIQNLKKQLDELVDADGRVAEKDRDRAQYIINELNEALGTELSLNGDIVESYEEMSNSVDKVIDAKKRKIIIDALEERQEEAIRDKSKFYKEWQDSAQKTAEAEEKVKNINKEVREDFSGFKFLLAGIGTVWSDTSNKTKEYTKALEDSQNATASAKEKYEQSINDTIVIGEALANSEKMTYEELQQIYNETTTIHNSANNTKLENLSKTLPQVIDELHRYKEAYEKNGNETARVSMESQQEMLDNAIATLVAETQVVEQFTPEMIAVWKELAEGDVLAYAEALAQLDDETVKRVEEATGVVVEKTPEMAEVSTKLGNTVVANFDKNADAKKAALDTLQGYLNGLSDSDKRQLLTDIGIEDVDLVLQELDRGELSEQNGLNILEGLARGLNNGTLKGRIAGIAAGIATSVNNAFSSIWQINSPSKFMQKLVSYYLEPITEGFKDQEKSITNIASKLAASVNETMIDGLIKNGLTSALDVSAMNTSNTYQVNTNIYTQKINDAEMNNVFRTVNKKLGMIGG